MLDSMTNDQLDLVKNISMGAMLAGLAFVIGAFGVRHRTRQLVTLGVGVVLVLCGCVSLLQAVIPLTDRSDANIVSKLEHRYGIEVGEHRFTEQVHPWMVDGTERRCAYVADDGDGRPALLCVGVTFDDRYAAEG